MEQLGQSLGQLLEDEAEFLTVCSDYLDNGREKPLRAEEYVWGLRAVHNARFDEIDAQMTRLENMAG